MRYDVFKMETVDAPRDSEIIWSGRPNLLVYLFSCCKRDASIVAIILAFMFLDPAFYIVTHSLLLLVLALIVYDIARFTKMRYYIINEGAVCKYAGKYFLSRWDKINPAGFKMKKTPFDIILRTGTVKINTIYGNTSNMKNNEKFQRKRGVFWGIADYEKVYSIVEKNLNKQ